MSNYSELLRRYVEEEGNTQSELAVKIGCTQVAVHRYVRGLRLPTSDLARRIDEATQGQVPFTVWRDEMARRHGLEFAA